MGGRLIGTWAPNTEPWYEARRGRLGASEIAAVVGLSPYESPFSLWHRKRGNLTEQTANDAMTVGHYVEAAVAQWWSDEHRTEVYPTGTYVSEDRDWQLANPDRVMYSGDGPPTPLECKYATRDDQWGQPGTDQIPVHYLTQVQWQMDVLGVAVCHVAVLLPGRLAAYVVHANAEDQAYLREAGRAFLDSVEQGIEPDIDDTSATLRALREMHPDIHDNDIDIDPDDAAAYVAAKRDAEKADRAARGMQSVVLHQMGTARRALANGQPVLRRQPGQGGHVALHTIKPRKTT